MVDPISGMLSICGGIFILIGVISVFLGGFGAIIGGASEVYDRPKQFLYFLYFASIFLAFYWVMLEIEALSPPTDMGIEVWALFIAYSSGVLVFHVMDYQWQKIGLGDLSDPPKIFWGLGGGLIWNGINFPMLSEQGVYDDFPMDDFAVSGLPGELVYSLLMISMGLAMVWGASTRVENDRVSSHHNGENMGAAEEPPLGAAEDDISILAFCVECGYELMEEWNACPSCGTLVHNRVH